MCKNIYNKNNIKYVPEWRNKKIIQFSEQKYRFSGAKEYGWRGGKRPDVVQLVLESPSAWAALKNKST